MPPTPSSPFHLLSLGPLESELMVVLCEQGESTVREVVEKIKRPLAYTTVMTTLDRLYKKGLLHRCKYGRGFRYSLRLSRPEIEESASAFKPADSLLVSYLVDAVEAYDESLLDELERKISLRRQALLREREGE